jgi:hypothetical protein
MMIHDDLMTSGLVSWDDPPQEESGMTRLKLDAEGRLTYFERIPSPETGFPREPYRHELELRLRRSWLEPI